MPTLITIADSAHNLHVTRRTIQRWIANGDLHLHNGLVDQLQAEHLHDQMQARQQATRFTADTPKSARLLDKPRYVAESHHDGSNAGTTTDSASSPAATPDHPTTSTPEHPSDPDTTPQATTAEPAAPAAQPEPKPPAEAAHHPAPTATPDP